MFNNFYYLTAIHGFITGVFKNKKRAEHHALSSSIFDDTPHIVTTIRGKVFIRGKLVKNEARAIQYPRLDGTMGHTWESQDRLDARLAAEAANLKKHADATEIIEKMILSHQANKEEKPTS